MRALAACALALASLSALPAVLRFDQVIDRWVRLLLRRKDPAPPPLLAVQAGP